MFQVVREVVKQGFIILLLNFWGNFEKVFFPEDKGFLTFLQF